MGLSLKFWYGLVAEADRWTAYRGQHGEGDPGKHKHRTDDPVTIAEMRKGRSA